MENIVFSFLSFFLFRNIVESTGDMYVDFFKHSVQQEASMIEVHTSSSEVLNENKKDNGIVVNNSDDLIKNKDFLNGKKWGYFSNIDDITENKLYNALLFSETQDKQGLQWKVKVLLQLQNNGQENVVVFRLENTAFKWSYDPNYEPGFNIGAIKVKFDDIPAKDYKISFNIMENEMASLFDNEVEDFVKNLRKSKRVIIDFSFEYGWSGYYYFNTEWVDF